MRIGIEAQRILRLKKHGMDVVALELIKSLQEIDRVNEYFIFCRNGEDKNYIIPTSNFHLHRFSALTYADWEQLHLNRVVRKYGIDLLHCTANTAPLRSKVPLILTLHDIIYLEKLEMNGTAYQNLGNVYRRFIVPQVVKNAAVIITVSEFEKENIVRRLQLPEEKVQVLYNGVSEQFNNNYSTAEIEEFRETYQLPERYIMFLANTAPKKNTNNVIKAFIAYCLEEKNPVPLVLLDYKRELITKMLEELKHPELIDHFVFPGYVPHQKMPLMYNAATLFLYPSLRESFGLPILESMACGTPVITSNTSSMPEIAGGAAEIIDPYDFQMLKKAIIHILSNAEVYSQYVKSGLQRCKSFTWRASAEKLLMIYNQYRGV